MFEKLSLEKKRKFILKFMDAYEKYRIDSKEERLKALKEKGYSDDIAKTIDAEADALVIYTARAMGNERR